MKAAKETPGYTYLINPEDWAYFASGGANILLQYNGPANILSDKLMRLRKNKTDVPNIKSKQVLDFMRSLEDRFYGSILEYDYIELDQNSVSNFESRFDIDDDNHALLVLNVTHGCSQSVSLSKHAKIHYSIPETGSQKPQIILEFKPKWLTPSDSFYCRNCSLAQVRNEKRHFCPLDLVCDSRIANGVRDLLKPIPQVLKNLIDNTGIRLEETLIKYLRGSGSILKTLRDLQETYDSLKVMKIQNENEVLEDLLRAFSLRDVGVFIKVIALGSRKVRVDSYVFDLDPKSPRRYKYWQETQKKVEARKDRINPVWKKCT